VSRQNLVILPKPWDSKSSLYAVEVVKYREGSPMSICAWNGAGACERLHNFLTVPSSHQKLIVKLEVTLVIYYKTLMGILQFTG
jgi:hypothetical protein